MRKVLFAAAIAAAAQISGATAGGHSTLAPDLEDPITLRINMMKQVGAATGLAAAMVKGEAEFDPRVAMAAFRTMLAVSLGFESQFGEGTETGHNTRAMEAIWNDRDGFDAAVASFLNDTFAAIEANPQDLESFTALFGKVTGNCKTCHETYRAPRQ